ncbi:L,D-transpeptidase [Caldalkalibacillus salinus]|uniref:L,D-transpeptidase n=1 Tax=Caldalkalibacillus salinus TaxID=2803787 RepID=UPI001F2D44B0|nr:L,D-transpeptidase [Caldalkalibacillus salinus]
MTHLKKQSRVILSSFLLILLFVSVPPNSQAQIPEEYEGVHLEIDLATNKLKVFLNTHEVFSYSVATGRNKTKTPLGEFKIVTKVKEPWYLPKQIAGGDPKNPLGTRWIGLSVPYTNGYKYGIHGTNKPQSIGHYVTDGCIRLQNENVEWLYDQLQKGTPVIITDSSLTNLELSEKKQSIEAQLKQKYDDDEGDKS